MFEEIGKKIKALAIGVFVFGICVGVIIGYSHITKSVSDADKFVGFMIILVGAFVSYLSTLTLYGFGELVDKVCDIADDVREIKSNTRNKGEGLDKIKTIKLDEYER